MSTPQISDGSTNPFITPLTEKDIIDYLDFDPTDPSKTNSAEAKKTEQGVAVTFSQADPAKGKDTLSKTLIIDPVSLKIFGVPTSSKEPLIPLPESAESSATTASGSSLQSSFADSLTQSTFMAAFVGIMSKVMSLDSKNRKAMADLSITSNSQFLSLAKDNAEFTIESAKERKHEMNVQAASAGVGGILAVGSLYSSVRNQGLAAKDPGVENLDKQITATKTRLDEDKGLLAPSPAKKPEGAMVSEDKAAIEAAAEKAKEAAKPPRSEEEIKADETNLNKLTTKRDAAFNDALRRLQQASQTYNEIGKSVNDTLSSAIRGSIEGKIGQIEAEKQMAQANQSVQERATSTAASNRDSEKNNIDKTADFILNILNTTFQSHKMSAG